MNRRSFLKALTAGATVSLMPGGKLWAADEDYSGKFLITLRANGGWDPTLFCDPKENVPGEKIITHWSETQQTRKIGNISYAPFGRNQSFFENHYKKMMVVNGIHTRTFSHKGGRYKMNTGGGSSPSISALFAATCGASLTLPWLIDQSDRTFSQKLLNGVKLGGSASLSNLVLPNQRSVTDTRTYVMDEDLELIRRFQVEQAQLNQSKAPIHKAAEFMQQFEKAQKNDPRLYDLGTKLSTTDFGNFANNSVNNYALFAISAFASGLAVSADFQTGGFDTHNRNDERQEGQYNSLLNAVDFIWHLAELNGIDDRLILQIESDFARTPKYNNKDGKDHWPVGSKVFMEKNARWANSVKGGSDEGQNALRFNAETLRKDNNGVQIEPKHVNLAFREYLGLESYSLADQFPLTNTAMPFFS